MTGEEAYWHACTGTPIDAPGSVGLVPPVVREFTSYVEGVYRYEFQDGIIVNLDAMEVARARYSAREFRNMLARKYFEAREARR